MTMRQLWIIYGHWTLITYAKQKTEAQIAEMGKESDVAVFPIILHFYFNLLRRLILHQLYLNFRTLSLRLKIRNSGKVSKALNTETLVLFISNKSI